LRNAIREQDSVVKITKQQVNPINFGIAPGEVNDIQIFAEFECTSSGVPLPGGGFSFIDGEAGLFPLLIFD